MKEILMYTSCKELLDGFIGGIISKILLLIFKS